MCWCSVMYGFDLCCQHNYSKECRIAKCNEYCLVVGDQGKAATLIDVCKAFPGEEKRWLRLWSGLGEEKWGGWEGGTS